jgi:hypothetical protein
MLNEAAESFARALHIKERELGQFHPSTAKVRKHGKIDKPCAQRRTERTLALSRLHVSPSFSLSLPPKVFLAL